MLFKVTYYVLLILNLLYPVIFIIIHFIFIIYHNQIIINKFNISFIIIQVLFLNHISKLFLL